MSPWGCPAIPRPALYRVSAGVPSQRAGDGHAGRFSLGLAPGPQGAPPRGGDGQGARAEVTVPAAVSAPRPGTEHVTAGPPPAPWTPGPTVALTSAPPIEQNGAGAPTFPRPTKELRGAGPRAPHPSPARPAAAAGPALCTHLETPCRCRQHPCWPWSRSPSPREEPPAQHSCPCRFLPASSAALRPGLSRRAAGAPL